MTQKVQVLLIDDIDGSEAAGTVRFGLDGAHYEIDLSAAHAEELRTALSRYAAAARRAGGPARPATRSGRKAAVNGINNTEIREWARTEGIEVKERGRIPSEVIAKFRAATGK
jgi:hypothetical protein